MASVNVSSWMRDESRSRSKSRCLWQAIQLQNTMVTTVLSFYHGIQATLLGSHTDRLWDGNTSRWLSTKRPDSLITAIIITRALQKHSLGYSTARGSSHRRHGRIIVFRTLQALHITHCGRIFIHYVLLIPVSKNRTTVAVTWISVDRFDTCNARTIYIPHIRSKVRPREGFFSFCLAYKIYNLAGWNAIQQKKQPNNQLSFLG